jgi:hypothetical protein
MATPPGLFVQLQSNRPSVAAAVYSNQQSSEFGSGMGYQCLADQGRCVSVSGMMYDGNYPLFDSIQQCQSFCSGPLAPYGSGGMKSDFK